MSYANRGIAFLVKGMEREAQADFDKYIAMAPEMKDVLEERIEKAKRFRDAKK